MCNDDQNDMVLIKSQLPYTIITLRKFTSDLISWHYQWSQLDHDICLGSARTLV